GHDPELDFGLSIVDREQARAAPRTEVSTAEFRRFPHALELLDRPDRIEGERRAAFLPAIGAVADAGAQGRAANRDPHPSAAARSSKHRHDFDPPGPLAR